MKSFLAIVGGTGLLIFFLIAGFFVYGFVKLGPIKAEAEAYAGETITAVTSTWNGDAIFERASSELKNTLEEGAVVELMGQGSRAVGDLVTLGNVECTTSFNTSTGEGTVYTANCKASSDHDRGKVDYALTVIKRDEEWALNGFHFNVTERATFEAEV